MFNQIGKIWRQDKGNAEQKQIKYENRGKDIYSRDREIQKQIAIRAKKRENGQVTKVRYKKTVDRNWGVEKMGQRKRKPDKNETA